jgi:hypothetical protein
VIPHLPRDFQSGESLAFKSPTFKGVVPFGQITRPCILCLQVDNPVWYSVSGIVMAMLSPLTTGKGSCDVGMSQTLLTASEKDIFTAGAEVAAVGALTV